jgi:dipeptidyl aminopeptidase/acylaminoacyl peptidase
MKILMTIILGLALLAVPAAGDDEARLLAGFCAAEGLSGRLAFTGYDDDSDGEIYYLDLTDGVVHRLTEDRHDDYSPALSPDGRRLAWVAERDGRHDVYLMELGFDGVGREVTRLTDSEGLERDLSWSADGESLYFSSHEEIDFAVISIAEPGLAMDELVERDEGYVVYSLDPDTGTTRRLSLPAGDYRSPVYLAGYGTVCRYDPWHVDVSRFRHGLVVIDAELNCDGLLPWWETREMGLRERLHRFPDGDLLVGFRVEDGSYFVRLDAERAYVEKKWYLSEDDIVDAVPDPDCEDCGWFVLVSADEELLFCQGVFSSAYADYLIAEEAAEPSWSLLR